jgi:hypothetical protein
VKAISEGAAGEFYPLSRANIYDLCQTVEGHNRGTLQARGIMPMSTGLIPFLTVVSGLRVKSNSALV